MGQYYKAVIANSDEVFVADSWDYGSGMKLMEHSWIGNDFANAVLTVIEGKPAKVCWVGDYADDVVDEPIDMLAFTLAWQCNGAKLDIAPKQFMFKDGETFGEGYLVNHTTAQYIDFADYVEKAKERDGYMKDYTVHPLPILTAIGNGLGGGDYHGTNEDMVGRWHMNLIEYAAEAPSEYTNITDDVIFKEGRA